MRRRPSEVLSNGPVPTKYLETDSKQAGIKDRTLDRARQNLGITSERIGGIGEGGAWMTSLPSPPGTQKVGTLRESGTLSDDSVPSTPNDNAALGTLSDGDLPKNTDLGTLKADTPTKGANQIGPLGTNVTKGANLLSRASIAEDDPDRCLKCGADMAESDGYYDKDGTAWCLEHGPDGQGENDTTELGTEDGQGSLLRYRETLADQHV